MEELISLVPTDLQRSISESSPEDLDYTCRSLLDFLLPLPQFQRVVRELTDPEMGKKSREAALELKKKGNDCFVGGDFAKALSFYSQKLGLLEECKQDCGRALLLSPVYVKAWYRRGKANLSLKNYEDAVHDLEAALGMESSSSGNNHIKEDLEMALSYFKSICGTSNSSSHLMNANMGSGSFEPGNITTEPHQVELQCISTQAKGKGMVSLCSIPPAALIHSEEPLAVIVLKNCWETRCHFCLDELPTDVMFCSSCAIPSYCSQQCQEKAIDGRSEGNLEGISEHRHECGWVNWPAVLPSDVVLVGRVMAKLVEKRQHFPKADGQMEILDFVHHYTRIPSESKLESHIFSIVLSFCLNHCFGSDFPFTGASVAQLRVGQAIYSTGRLFNHSCRPNIHAYFLSHKLLLCSTEFIPAGFPLELSYGPQVGQWGLHDRQKLLEDQYFFKCQCSGCSELNLSDLVINAFRCVKPTCLGAVLEDHLADSRMTGENFADPSTKICSLQLPLPVSSQKKDVIDEVAHVLLERPVAMLQMCPGFCLNCCSKCDLKSLVPLARTACVRIDRLKNGTILQKSLAVLPDALRSLSQLRSVRHAYSKDIAQAEGIIAETFCAVGDLKSALEHSKASIKGTISLELLDQVPNIDTIIVPISGGGLISGGVSLAAKAINPSIRVLAAEPSGEDDAAQSKLAGKIVVLSEINTIADGLRASLGNLTCPVVRDLVDDVVTVDDREIVEAMRMCYEILKVAVEPSGAIGLAAVLSDKFQSNPAWKSSSNIGIVLSGGNVDLGNLWESFKK